MSEKSYEIKKIYYLLLGIKESIIHRETEIPIKVANQYNNLIDELESLVGDSLQTYKVGQSEQYENGKYKFSHRLISFQSIRVHSFYHF